MADLSKALAIVRGIRRDNRAPHIAKSAGDNGDIGDRSEINSLAASRAGDTLGTGGDIAGDATGTADALSPVSPECPPAENATNALKTLSVPAVPNVPTRNEDMRGAFVPSAALRTSDPADLIAAYHERVAICVTDGGMSETEAHRIATEQCGALLEVLARRQIDHWRQRIDAMPIGHRYATIARDCFTVIDAATLQRAVTLGWDETALFGVHPAAPLVRIECWGLLAGLILSPHNRRDSYGQMRRSRLVEIDAHRALIETPTGARFGVDRFGHGRDESVPVWDIADIAVTAEAA